MSTQMKLRGRGRKVDENQKNYIIEDIERECVEQEGVVNNVVCC